MKRFFLFTLLLLAASLCAQSADTLSFPQPQFVNPVFDSYSRNYIGGAPMGRANTGVSVPGALDNVLNNPASYNPEQSAMHLEMLIKPPVNTNIYVGENNFYSPVPFGMVGVGGKLGRRLSGAFVYSLPKSITMDAFRVEMNLGNYVLVREPVYNLHQISANLGYHLDNLHLGLNLHNQFHYLGEFTVLRSFELLNDVKYLLRPQFGALYTTDMGNIGLTFSPEQAVNWDLKYVQYDTVMPMQIGTGVSIKDKNRTYIAELEWQNTSAIDTAYNDRLIVKAGFEADVRKFTYRLGYMYHPQVWEGIYRYPLNTTANADTSLWWDSVQSTGRLSKNTQHLLSAGFTWHHRDGAINLALLHDVLGKSPVTQVNASLSLYFSAFRRKGFLFFE